MKKKVLAFLLASTMVIEPFSVASAADFSDGMGQDTVQFSDDAEDVPEVENNEVDQFGTDAVGEGEESTETHVQIGDKVWVDFDNDNGIATISGEGSTWDYFLDGTAVPDSSIINPFVEKKFNKVIIKNGVTRIGDYLFHASRHDYEDDPWDARNTEITELEIADTVTEIGKYSFYKVTGLSTLNFPNSLQKIGSGAFGSISSLKDIQLNNGLKQIGYAAFGATDISEVELPQTVTELGEYIFSGCESLREISGFENLTIIPDGLFKGTAIDDYNFSKITEIGAHSFENTNIKKLDFTSSNNLGKIGVGAFEACTMLKDVVLSDSIEEIGAKAFSQTVIKSIVLPNSIKALGEEAFYDCKQLESVQLSNQELFLGSTFKGCIQLKSIIIPEKIKMLDRTFSGCKRLSTVTFNGAKTKLSPQFTESNPFGGCASLSYISGFDCSYANKFAEKYQVKFVSLGKGSHQFTAEKVQIKEPTCTEKGSKAYRCEICGEIQDEEEIPAYGHKWDNGVITKEATEKEDGVRTYTCRRCNETKTEIIPKLSAINLQISQEEQYWNGHYQYSFYCISDKDITYYVECVKKDSGQPVYDDTKQDGKIKENGGRWINVDITDEDAVDIYIFATNTNGDYVYKKVTPNYDNRPQKPAIKVGDNATAIIDGDTITITGTGETYGAAIDWDDILNRSNIKHIVVEDGIISIGQELFCNFKNIKTVILPNSLKRIDTWAFTYCQSLESIVIPEGVTEMGVDVFDGCSGLKSISLPSTLRIVPCLGELNGSDISGLPVENITLNNGIETIGERAFQDMNNLKTIIIPDSVTFIEDNAFNNCSVLTNLVLPDSITTIGNAAFSGCTSLEKIVLPSKLTSLGNVAFGGCNAEIIFPSSLKSIPELGSNAVKKVTIPEGVETIGYQAFCSCSNLTEITLPSTITSIESEAFEGTGITSFNYPQNITNIPNGAFANTNLTEFSVPEKVTEIDDNAFYNCYDLTKISIPKSVTYIGSDVFKYCRNLTIYGYKDTAAESYAKANNIKFVSADYKVIFKDNGRTQKTEYVTKGQNATPPTLSAKDGYTLSWDADYTNIQEDMVINAVWTKKDSGNGGGNTTIIVSPSETNKYTVTFKDRGKIVKTEKVKSGDAAEYPYINRNGYELSWDKDFSKVTADITVNAVWTVIKPNKVTSLTAEVQKNSIDLSWDRAENTDYYLVYRKATSDTEYKQIKKTTKILWTDEDVEPGTEYSYKVVGVCSVDGKKYQGADSDIVTAKIGTPQIGNVYSVGDLKYKVTGAKEVSVIGLAKEEVEIKIPSAVSISGKAYKVTSVQAKAFYQNEDIVSIAIGNNVIYIGKYAFYQCPNLETVKFGKRVSVISTCAFTQCSNLDNVTLPSSIRRIGAKAFYQCTSIKVLKINGSVLEYVGKKGLAVNKTVTLRHPKKVYTKYKKLIKISGVYSKTKFVKF
ncbi:leucine-rich repeat protein [Blautia wexlerae]|uniref:leucine-rich repeat protein n=1 Tax=Blautia wexlerae TaxID=418240 RepID=UPI00156F4DAE|nr:leucine-rich repeat protein [Blautia wexlerae]NSE02486.1 leucine-rich repeat protein [Blautia wexlerae]NSF76155.1 leucine-rich repeat protein [Blautia wexlerae]